MLKLFAPLIISAGNVNVASNERVKAFIESK